MGVGQAMVVGVAVAIVVAAYVRWVAERLSHPRGRLAAEQNMFLLVAPVGLSAVAVGIALWSWEAGGTFALVAFSLRLPAGKLVGAVRAWRRRRPVEPEDRQRRIDERTARRRARARAYERYGPPARERR